jgi:tetratricopeptide (TPR) repeat protein
VRETQTKEEIFKTEIMRSILCLLIFTALLHQKAMGQFRITYPDGSTYLYGSHLLKTKVYPTSSNNLPSGNSSSSDYLEDPKSQYNLVRSLNSLPLFCTSCETSSITNDYVISLTNAMSTGDVVKALKDISVKFNPKVLSSLHSGIVMDFFDKLTSALKRYEQGVKVDELFNIEMEYIKTSDWSNDVKGNSLLAIDNREGALKYYNAAIKENNASSIDPYNYFGAYIASKDKNIAEASDMFLRIDNFSTYDYEEKFQLYLSFDIYEDGNEPSQLVLLKEIELVKSLLSDPKYNATHYTNLPQTLKDLKLKAGISSELGNREKSVSNAEISVASVENLLTLGTEQMDITDYVVASQIYTEAYNIAVKLNDQSLIYTSSIRLAEAEIGRKEYKNAIKILNKIVDIENDERPYVKDLMIFSYDWLSSFSKARSLLETIPDDYSPDYYTLYLYKNIAEGPKKCEYYCRFVREYEVSRNCKGRLCRIMKERNTPIISSPPSGCGEIDDCY